jgi:hypothetical protein
MRSTRRLLVVALKQGYCITVIGGVNIRGHVYQAYLARSGIQASMSRKGNCWDNSAMESWIANIKR